MGQLTKNMYRQGSQLFDLSDGQLRRGASKVTHNSGWYNQAGESLGWGGDLSVSDMQHIQDGLEPGELFILLGDQGARFPRSRIPDLDCPGAAYVAEHCCYIINKKNILMVAQSHVKPWDINGVMPKIISRTTAKKMIIGTRKCRAPNTRNS